MRGRRPARGVSYSIARHGRWLRAAGFEGKGFTGLSEAQGRTHEGVSGGSAEREERADERNRAGVG